MTSFQGQENYESEALSHAWNTEWINHLHSWNLGHPWSRGFPNVILEWQNVLSMALNDHKGLNRPHISVVATQV